jgi:hypothetical protein
MEYILERQRRRMLLAKKQKNGFVIAMNLYIAKQIAGKSRKFDAYGFSFVWFAVCFESH